jgi:hypothetical protein
MNKLAGFLAVSLLSFTALPFGQQLRNQKGEVESAAQEVKTFVLAGEPVVGTDGSTSVPYAGYQSTFYVNVGPGEHQELTLTVWGLHFHAPHSAPASIQCQPRQSENEDHGYPDAFACQVLSTDSSGSPYYDRIKVRLRRLDSPHAWGQDLRLDFVVFEAANL